MVVVVVVVVCPEASSFSINTMLSMARTLFLLPTEAPVSKCVIYVRWTEKNNKQNIPNVCTVRNRFQR